MLIQDAGPLGLWVIALALLTVPVALVSVGLWLFNRRLSPALLGLMLGALALTPLVTSGPTTAMAFDALGTATDEMRMVLLATSAASTMAISRLTAICLTAIYLPLIAATGLVAIIRGPRGFVAPSIAAALGLLAVGSALYAAIAANLSLVYPVLYATLLVPAVASQSAKQPAPPDGDATPTSTSAPLAAAMCATAFAAFVAIGEADQVARASREGFLSLAWASYEAKAPLLDALLDEMSRARLASLTAVLSAAGIAVTGAVNALDAQRPSHNAGVWLMLLAALAPMLVAWSSPSLHALSLVGLAW